MPGTRMRVIRDISNSSFRSKSHEAATTSSGNDGADKFDEERNPIGSLHRLSSGLSSFYHRMSLTLSFGRESSGRDQPPLRMMPGNSNSSRTSSVPLNHNRRSAGEDGDDDWHRSLDEVSIRRQIIEQMFATSTDDEETQLADSRNGGLLIVWMPRRHFRVVWWLLMCFHALNVVCYGLLGIVYIAIPQNTFLQYLLSMIRTLPLDAFLLVAVVYFAIGLGHVYSMLSMLFYSIKRGELATRESLFNKRMTIATPSLSKSPTSLHPRQALTASMFPGVNLLKDESGWLFFLTKNPLARWLRARHNEFSRWHNKLLGVNGVLGFDSQFFDVVLLVRRVVDVTVQTYQAYLGSLYIPKNHKEINQLLVCVVLCSCWVPTANKYLRIKPDVHMERLIYYVVSIVNNFLCFGLSFYCILLDYYEQYDPEQQDFALSMYYDDVWLVKCIKEFRFFLIFSWINFFWRTLPMVHVLMSISSLKLAIERQKPIVLDNSTIVVPINNLPRPSVTIDDHTTNVLSVKRNKADRSSPKAHPVDDIITSEREPHLHHKDSKLEASRRGIVEEARVRPSGTAGEYATGNARVLPMEMHEGPGGDGDRSFDRSASRSRSSVLNSMIENPNLFVTTAIKEINEAKRSKDRPSATISVSQIGATTSKSARPTIAGILDNSPPRAIEPAAYPESHSDAHQHLLHPHHAAPHLLTPQRRLDTVLKPQRHLRGTRSRVKHKHNRRQHFPIRGLIGVFIHALFFFWGVSVLIFYLRAMRYSISNHFPECQLEMRPWNTLRYACAVLEVDCAAEKMTNGGSSYEIAKFLNKRDFGLTVLTTIVFANCFALQIPSNLASYGYLTGLKIYNSTLDKWDESLRDDLHPFFSYLFFVKTRFNTRTGLTGFFHDNLPAKFFDMELCDTNFDEVYDLMDNQDELFATRWGGLKYLYLEQSRLQRVPSFLAKVAHTTRFSLAGNALTKIPEDIFADHELDVLNLSDNPGIDALPGTVRAVGATLLLDFANTKVHELPLWLTSAVLDWQKAAILGENSMLCRAFTSWQLNGTTPPQGTSWIQSHVQCTAASTEPEDHSSYPLQQEIALRNRTAQLIAAEKEQLYG